MIPVNYKKKAISFHDESLAVQVRLFKSLKLWSFRVDLEESIGTVETTQKAYDSIFELKIANAQVSYPFPRITGRIQEIDGMI